ncbi:MAG TPA: PAS domain-containing protein, partial [Thermodesulfobacteriota bacterium]|nr:PAS domain-containing protein [Thermodesulfobacteriota bacterium]
MTRRSREALVTQGAKSKDRAASQKKGVEYPQPSEQAVASNAFGLDTTGCLVIEGASFDDLKTLFGKLHKNLSVDSRALPDSSWPDSRRKRNYREDGLPSKADEKKKFFYHLIAPVATNEQARKVHRVTIDETGIKEAHDGLEKEARSRIEALHEENSRLRGEISRIKGLGKTLRESAQRYRSLFEQSPICLWEFDCSALKRYIALLRRKGVANFRNFFKRFPEALTACAATIKAVDTNEASVKTCGAASKEDLLQGYTRFFAGKPSDLFLDGIIAYAEGHDSFECEAVQQTFDGEKKYFSLKWVIVSGPRGRRTRLISSLVDITMLNETREEFRKFKIISDEANSGNAICDLKGTFLYVNEAFARMHGYTTEELLGKYFSILMPDDQKPNFPALGKSLFKNSARSLKDLEIQHLRKDRTPIHTLTNVKLITDKQGSPQYIALSTLDSTVRKETEENLLTRERELEEKNTRLEEMNTALNVFLRNRQMDKLEIEDKILANIKTVVFPLLRKLRTSALTKKQQTQLSIVESALNVIMSPFLKNISSKYSDLTQAEL